MDKGKWWNISNSVSLLFLVLIGFIWVYTNKKYDPNVNQLTNQAEVNKYLTDNFPDLPRKRIPTGVFVESFKFNNSSEVTLSGYVWQIYEQSEYKDVNTENIPVGFIFPEAVERGSNVEPKLVFREKIEGNKEVITWLFEATLKQKFNYSKYPFDHKTVWIRFWSRDFGQQNVLVPSFASYESTELNDSFGYDSNIVLGQWQLLNTFFDYRKQRYNTAFGIYDQDNQKNQPELYFNIVIKRRFLNSFIIHILPLVIIACLVFATLMMITKDEKQASMFGINTSGVIGVCSGLFFLILVSQVQIREQFAGSSTVYVEFFYPLMYVSLLGISVNSYLFSRINKGNNSVLKWIDYEDNIIPKLIYWPVLLGSATIISAVILLAQEETSKLNQNQQQSFLLDKRFSANKETRGQEKINC
ncbi:MAG: hypothetical protein AAF063_21320 [Cyanobacteria bacterium J06643_5]